MVLNGSILGTKIARFQSLLPLLRPEVIDSIEHGVLSPDPATMHIVKVKEETSNLRILTGTLDHDFTEKKSHVINFDQREVSLSM